LFGDRLKRRNGISGILRQGLAVSVEAGPHFFDHVGVVYPLLQPHEPRMLQHLVHGGKVSAGTGGGGSWFSAACGLQRSISELRNAMRHHDVAAPGLRATA
jgi:hypothetical protein